MSATPTGRFDRSMLGSRTALAAVILLGIAACGDDPAAPTTTAPTTTAAPTATTSVAVDGLVWSRVLHDAAIFGGLNDQRMSSVTAGGPGLVAVGSDSSGGDADAAVWTSPDGLVWARVPHDDAIFGGPIVQAMNSVTAGGPGLVAVGHGGNADAAVWTSPDGLVWARVPHDDAIFGGPGGQGMYAVTAGGPGLVAVGWGDAGGDADALVWTSPDGLVWSRVPHDDAIFGGPGGQGMSSVTAGGPGLVAVGGDDFGGGSAAVWTSPDGLVWARVPHDDAIFGGPGGQWMSSVTAGGPGLVAVGGDDFGGGSAAVWTSPDGLAWSRVPHDGGPDFQWMQSVVAGGPGLVAVGWDDSGGGVAAVWTSTNALVWSRVPHDEVVFGGSDARFMSSVVVGGPGLVAVGTDGTRGDQVAAVWVSPPPG